MSAKLYDAHCHYHHSPVVEQWDTVGAIAIDCGLTHAIINGTEPSDWNATIAWAKQHPFAIPAVGLHPWYLGGVQPGFQYILSDLLDSGQVMLGEIGLDRCRPKAELEQQDRLFIEQLKLANEKDVVTTIHCVRAVGRLYEFFHDFSPPTAGFLLHAYSGSTELILSFASQNAYFSCSANTLSRPKANELIRAIPIDRLLIETDAPYMAPPEFNRLYVIQEKVDDRAANHPANLKRGYELAAEHLQIPLPELIQIVEENFLRLFGPYLPQSQ